MLYWGAKEISVQYFLHEYLGPLLGFLFTTGTILFVALNADKTARPGQLAPEAATPSDAQGA